MPTYEYKCGNCGHRFEKFSSRITNSANEKCPECEGTAERLISGGAGVLFKGSGFYATDYRSESYKKAENKDKGGTDKKSSSGEAKDSSSGTDKASKKG